MDGMGAVDHEVGRPIAGGLVHCGDGFCKGLARGQTAVCFNCEGDDYRDAGLLGGLGDADGLFGVIDGEKD